MLLIDLKGQPANDNAVRRTEILTEVLRKVEPAKPAGPPDYIDMGNGKMISWEKWMSE